MYRLCQNLRQTSLTCHLAQHITKSRFLVANAELQKKLRINDVQMRMDKDYHKLFHRSFYTLFKSKHNDILVPVQLVKPLSFNNAFVSDSSSKNEPEDATQSLSLYQRFKLAYKKHGKTLLAVHISTSVVWYGSFFYAVQSGVDVVSWLEHHGASETILKPFKVAGLGDFAVAYLMYKLATPARYTVTLAGTNLAIKSLKKRGYIEEVSKEDKLRSLMKESREVIKERTDDWKDKIQKQKQK